ncbi:MAG: ABC transporter substrate-binding protein [Myxococcota bacterium]
MSEHHVESSGAPGRQGARVVSLLPSATEIVALIGCAEQLVGVSHECDFPEAARALPALTSSRLVDPGSSRGIDMDVRRLVRDVLSIYSVDPDALREAEPDVVITQDLCEVCAVSLDDVQAALARLAHRDEVEIVTLSPTRLGHVLEDVVRVARALGVGERGEREAAALAERIDTIKARSARARTRPRVVSVEWLEPIMLGGTWMPELIEFAGGTPVGVETGAATTTVTRAEFEALEPDVVLLKPCGFSLERSMEERELIDEICAALATSARVFLADGNAFFNRSGPRLVESLEILAACIHPNLFADFAIRHQGAFVSIA